MDWFLDDRDLCLERVKYRFTKWMPLKKYNFDFLNIFFKMNFPAGINLFKIVLLFLLLTLNK